METNLTKEEAIAKLRADFAEYLKKEIREEVFIHRIGYRIDSININERGLYGQV